MFLDRVVQAGGDLSEAIRRPRAVARALDISVSTTVLAGLKALRATTGRMDAADREVLAFFNKVVVDGRYIHEFTVDPPAVARKLKLKLSKKANERLKKYRIADVLGIRTPGSVMSPAAVAVVVAAIIVLWSRETDKVVVDRSGKVKL
jgi:hypothetical protein